MSLLVAIAASVAVICLVLSLRGLAARSRRRRFKGLELRPNCLLTRYPIIFLSQPKSLFRIVDDWCDVPLFLREHGYDVLILTPARHQAVESVLATIKELDGRCHLIAVESQSELIEKLSDARLDKIASLTLVQKAKPRTRSSSLTVDSLRPARHAVEIFELAKAEGLSRGTGASWQFESLFLDYAISLAERDAGWCDH